MPSGIYKHRNKYWLGKHFSEEHRRKISKSCKGRILSKKTKRKISESNKGQIPWNKGKHHSEETKKKMSLANKGKKHLEETKRKISVTNKKLFKKGILKPFWKGKHLYKEAIKKQKEFWNTPEMKRFAKERRAKIILPLKDSSIEIKIQNFLKQLRIEFFTHQYMKIPHGYQCDILIPSMNMVIECDGDYWHKYPIGREIDKIRTFELLQKGFNVLRFWECEIRKMELNDFSNRLKSVTLLQDSKIYKG